MNDGTEVHGFVDQSKKIQRISFLVVGEDFLLSFNIFSNFFLADFFWLAFLVWCFWYFDSVQVVPISLEENI